MKQLKVLPLVAIISGLIVGCGGGSGGGGGSNTVTKYTWQMINLYATEKSQVENGCVIYGEQAGQPGKVITARVANTGFKVLYHNEDGSVIPEETTDVIPLSGRVTIDPTKVPDNGYVSVEELDGTIGGAQDVYMFSIQKDFLRNLVVNIRQSQSSANACLKGEQHLPEISDNAVVTVAQESTTTKYYQSSFINASVAGQELASRIPVRAPLRTDEKVLITAFDSYLADQYSDLKYFVFADGASIYDVTDQSVSVPLTFLQSVDVSDVNFISDGISLSKGSSVIIGLNNELYQWQPIYDSTKTLSYSDSNIEANGWAVELVGSIDLSSWRYHSLSQYQGLDVPVEIPTVMEFDSSTISSGSASCGGAEYCLSAVGYTPDNYNIQRTHLRSTTSNNSRSFYQTIFAKPNDNQVLMASSEEVLVPNDGLDRLEVSVAQLESKDNNTVMYFLENNLDIQKVVTTNVTDFSDVNGSVSTASNIKNRKLKLLSGNVIILENGKN